MERKLQMGFSTTGEKAYTVTITNAKDNLTDEQVKAAMQGIVTKNIFMTKNGELAAIKNAKVVETTVREMDVTK